ncbi:MAG: NOP5/NOP56 family protein [archaeon]
MDKVQELRKKMIAQTQKKVTEKLSGKEAGAIKAANIIEDLDFAYNLLAEQTIEWYYFHFPELQRLVPDSETYLKLAAHLGERKNFTEKNILEQYNNPQKAKQITDAAQSSLGVELDKKEMDEIKLLAINVQNLKDERKFLTKFLEQKMNAILPNFCGLCGPILAAKFLSKAGSLKRLAMFPSSTIQVLGAEKALFSHLKNNTKPPKHGYLYSHPLVKDFHPKQKGKAAKLLAAKLSIAAKEDYFGEGKKIWPELKKELDKKVLRINV